MPEHNQMRVAVVTTFPPGMGSLNEYAFHFVRALGTKGEVSEVILLVDEQQEGRYDPALLPAGGAPVAFDVCWRFDDWRNPWRIRQAVKKHRPDVVLFNLQFATFGGRKGPAALGLLTPLLIRWLGIPTMVLLHNIMETVDLRSAGYAAHPLMERLIRTFGRVATRAILQANLVALTIPVYVDILKATYGADNVLLAPHGTFDHDLPEDVPPLPEGPLQIMTFGKFGTYKRIEALVEAFSHLQSNGRGPLELVIAGSDSPNAAGYLSEVQTRYEHVPNVRFTGYVAEEDVPQIFGEAAVVVFPYTSTTGSSGVLHQAGSYGRAAVLPDIGDFAQVIREEGYTGEFFEPDDPASLREAIARVVDDPEHRDRLGRQNLQAARGLPIDEVVDWYIFHLENLLQKKSRKRAAASG